MKLASGDNGVPDNFCTSKASVDGRMFARSWTITQKGTKNLESWPDYADFRISISLVSIKVCLTK